MPQEQKKKKKKARVSNLGLAGSFLLSVYPQRFCLQLTFNTVAYFPETFKLAWPF